MGTENQPAFLMRTWLVVLLYRKYLYAPLEVCKEQATFVQWEEEIMARWGERNTWIKNIYWRLDEMSCVLVLRNKIWFETAIPMMQSLWEIIEKERIAGYAHRAPKSRVASCGNDTVPDVPPQCLVIL